MFRKSTLALVAIFGLAAANNLGQPKTPKAPKAPKAPKQGGGAHSSNHLTKLTYWDACARYPQYASPQASQGAFTFPIHGGACPVAAGSAPDGVLSGVCGMNPYGGRQYTNYRVSTGGGLVDVVGDGNCVGPGDCRFNPAGWPQFPNAGSPLPVIDNTNGAADNAAQVQALADNWCSGQIPGAQTSTCFGTLAVRGTPGPKNKYPGSELDLVWNTTTTYQFVGSTYTTETQYGLGGWEDDANDYLFQTDLWGYTIFTSITCQFVPDAITHTPAVVYGGSGKFEKTPGAIVDPVTLTTTVLSAPTTVANPYNIYQNLAPEYQTAIRVNYIKKGGYLHWSLL